MRRKRRSDTAIVLSLMFALLAAATPVTSAQSGVTVTLKDTSLTIPVGSSRQMTATVTGTANTTLNWYVNNIAGGNANVGTISSTGNYVSPANIAIGTTLTIKATSAADNTASATCAITIRNQIPYITGVTPNPLPAGPFTLTVNGSRYVSVAQVLLNNSPLQTNFVSSTQLTATGNWNGGGSATVNVVNPGPGAVSVNFALGSNPTPTPTPTPTPAPSPSVIIMPASATVQVSGTQQFQATVQSLPNTQVNWLVNGIAGGGPTVGTINASGLYTGPGVMPFMGVLTVTAVSAADNTTKATANVNLQDPQSVTVGRFLEQATFGPTPQLMAHVRQVGFNTFLDEQFATPESPWPDYTLPATTRGDAVNALFYNAGAGQDQLRQRTLYALSQVWVVALNKNTNADMILPHLQILSRNAFGNYRTLMREMTLSSSMGMYLDLANSMKPGGTVGANENYPRELMQLFTIGLWQLNPDGSQKLDQQGNPLPTYTQTDVQQLARALTGWTYPTPPGKQPGGSNYNYQPGVMEARQSNHDTTQKTFLGQTLPANQSITQDLDGALDIVFNHPNVGPFVATRLIRALVTSNPSPAYIQRVAGVFADNGQGVRGDMQAVVRAILMDQEARNDQPPPNFGKLRSPMLYALSLMRALQAAIPQQNQSAYLYYSFGEGMLDPASVFGHYSPLYRIPKTTLSGPEFQIYSPTEAVNRGNYIYQELSLYHGGAFDITPFVNIASDPVQLVNAVDNALLMGRMSAQTRASIYKALQASSDNRMRALTALYLTAMSGEYLVQH
ncbi:MAG: hypothetical protein QOD00_1467 [Blastocatellia bacterium]|jgi:uncharacterized protein (DUF1800 family)|nr:hypothetical protein [Blastocatellia bacterium]